MSEEARKAIKRGDDAMQAVVDEAKKGDVPIEVVQAGGLAAQANYLRAIALALVDILEEMRQQRKWE